MDKEKALKIWLPVIADGVKDLPECKESLEMAIEALENQTSVIAELKKIKAEMEKDKIILFYAPQKVEILNEWIEKLDKRIAELKGENKCNLMN